MPSIKPVRLPTGPISVDALCKAIAEAVHPTVGLRGIDCVLGWAIPISAYKPILHKSAVASQRVAGKSSDRARRSASSVDRTEISPDECSISQKNAGKCDDESRWALSDFVDQPNWSWTEPLPANFAIPFEFEDGDMEWLLSAMRRPLSKLIYPITSHQAKSFLEEFRKLRGDVNWQPNLISAEAIEKRRELQQDVVLKHKRDIQSAFEHGRLRIFGQSRSLLSSFTELGQISHADSIKYLESRDIPIEVSGLPKGEALRKAIALHYESLSQLMTPRLALLLQKAKRRRRVASSA